MESLGEHDAVGQVASAIRAAMRSAFAQPLLLAIDGRSGAGKTMLAQAVARELEAALVVSDDFFAGGDDSYWLALSPEDRVERGIDWRRLRHEALEPLLAGRHAIWHPLDFEPGVGWVGWKDETVSVAPADVIIVDGVYSARPELTDLLGLSVLVEASDAVRHDRLLKREGQELVGRWHAIWDVAEDLYFDNVRPRESFDVILTTG